MPSNRITECFQRNSSDRKGALLPYFTAGYPDSQTTARLIQQADAIGVTGIEIGFPYSDSIADGPVIQDSFHRVLARGCRIDDIFDTVTRVRPNVRCALLAMTSYSIIHRVGVETFMRRAADAGFDGVIVPDVPIEESGATADRAADADLAYVGLIAPTTSPRRRASILRHSTGFIYQIAATGTTGERGTLAGSLEDEVSELRESSRLPVCVGFGISSPAHVRAVCQFADGAIVGSAIVRRVREGVEAGHDADTIVETVSGFLAELMAGTRPPSA